jgi:general stress protein 26
MASEAVERALMAARETMAKLRYCWAMTPSADGGVNARGMGRLAKMADDEWTLWFLTDGRSRKVDEVRRAGRMTVGFALEGEGSYVALIGRAALIEDRATIRARWRESWNRIVERGKDDPNIVFMTLEVGRIELCMEEGKWSATLERDAARQWHLAPAGVAGAAAEDRSSTMR